MGNLTISVFGNQIFFKVINELKLFSKFKTKFYENFNLFEEDSKKQDQLIIFFTTKNNEKEYERIIKNKFPLILIGKFSKKKISHDCFETINLPFRILDLENKIILLLAKYKFKKDSLINLNGYIIDNNERKIKKNNIELQLTEKEINFLILFSQTNKPLSRVFILENVWNYSSKSETHTVETHIHRLRKKILEKFSDKNFIKNDSRGYYI